LHPAQCLANWALLKPTLLKPTLLKPALLSCVILATSSVRCVTGLREMKGLMPMVARSRADSWDLGRRVSRRLPCGDVEGSLT
jgi:hypothetical protein